MIEPMGLRSARSTVAGIEDLLEAWRLVYRVYLLSGLIPPNPYEVHVAPHAVSSRSLVSVLRSRGRIAGTVTAMGDMASLGLPLDAVFPSELGDLRSAGGRLMEFGLFAHDLSIAGDRRALIDLLRTCFCFGIAMGYTDLLAGVAPHHARFYEGMFGFRRISGDTVYPGLNSAPVTLLRADVEEVRANRQTLRALADLPEEALTPEWFADRYVLASPEIAASAIGSYLDWRGYPRIGVEAALETAGPDRTLACA